MWVAPTNITRTKEHFGSECSSIFKHLHENQQCKMSLPEKQFTILDYASPQYELTLKEGLPIKWIKGMITLLV